MALPNPDVRSCRLQSLNCYSLEARTQAVTVSGIAGGGGDVLHQQSNRLRRR